MIEFNIKIADETFHITCRRPRTKELFEDYAIDEAGEIPLFPTKADLEKTHKSFDEENIKRGMEPVWHSVTNDEYHSLHRLMAHALIPKSVLLVHGSAVVAHGGVCLFIAPSGTGKSTHTALWTQLPNVNAYIINDDKPMIRITEDGALVYPTPWGVVEKPDGVDSAPLKAVVLLERGEKNHIEQVSYAQMFLPLFKAALRGNSAEEQQRILAMEHALLSRVKLFCMQCKPDLEAAEMAYQIICNS